MKQLTIILFLLTATFCHADISVKDFLAYLKGKTDQSTSHISDPVAHVTASDHLRIDGAVLSNSGSATNLSINGFVGGSNATGTFGIVTSVGKITTSGYFKGDLAPGDLYAVYKNGSILQFGQSSAWLGLSFLPGSIEAMRIVPSGNVGINTNTPSEKLHVNGNVLVASNLTVRGTITASNLLTVANSVTNQAVVSPVGTNNISSVWRGTYTQYLALTNRTDSTTYFIEDDNLVYDTTGIYSELISYTAIAPTTTVQIVSDKASYYIDFTNNCTIVADTNEVNLVNKIANFQLVVNLSNTNAMSPVFGSMFDWGGTEPEFTVTGRYEFACTMIGDGKLRIKQTYPTVYQWVHVPISVNDGSSVNHTFAGAQLIAAGSTNGTCATFKRSWDKVEVCRFYLYSDNAAQTNFFSFYHTVYGLYASASTTPILFSFVGASSVAPYISRSVLMPKAAVNQSDNYQHFMGVRAIRSGSLNTLRVLSVIKRDANELEIRHLDAGGTL